MKAHEIVLFLVEKQNQLRILHWQTKGYARHMAYGGIYEALDDLIDSFVEGYQGKYGRFELPNNATVSLLNVSNDKMNNFIDETVKALCGDMVKELDKDDTNLLNIRDEMLQQFNKLKYLLTLE